MTILALGSIHWISVAYCYDLALFYNSVVVFTRKPFSPELVLDLLEKYRITAINCQPLFANAVAHHPRAKTANLSSLALWGIGGYFVSDSVRDAIDAILPKGKSYTIYASTECGLIATDLFQRKRGAVGTVSPNMQIRVVDDDGNALGVGESGELLLKRSIPFGVSHLNLCVPNDCFCGYPNHWSAVGKSRSHRFWLFFIVINTFTPLSDWVRKG